MLDRETRVMQKKMLYRKWRFRIDERETDNDPFIWRLNINNMEIVWNIASQTGAYTIYGGELNLILGWEMLENLMEQIFE